MLVRDEGPPQNNQDAFNRVWKWFVTEGHTKAMAIDGFTCLYRTPDGMNACGVGCLIPDNHPSLNKLVETNSGIYQALEVIPELEDFFFNVSVDLLIRLQEAHDKTIWPKDDWGDDWPVTIKKELESVAESYSLTIPNA